MKKLLLPIFAILFLFSCDPLTEDDVRNIVREDLQELIENCCANPFDLDMSESYDSPNNDILLDLSDDINGEVLVIVDIEVEDNQGGNLEEAEVDLLVTLASGSTATEVDELIEEVRFLVDGDAIDTDDVSTLVTDVGVIVTYYFDLDDMEVEAGDNFEIEIQGDFDEIESNSEFTGATLTVEEIRLIGEGATGDNFIFTEITPYAPVLTALPGIIEITWTEEPIVYSADNGSGHITFSVQIENNTGSPLTGMDNLDNWNINISGYTIENNGYITDTVLDGDESSAAIATIADGDDEEYHIILGYTDYSSEEFSITIQELGIENVPVNTVWQE